MSGHSKWSKIKHKKGATDAMRGKIFAKLGKEIFVAAKNGDSDPDNNASLRLAIDKAKAQSMPKDNIERAIARAKGPGNGINYEEIVYEGYASNGVAVMCYCLTDNRNRTAAFIKSSFSKAGGNLGNDGSVSFMFSRLGVIVFEVEQLSSPFDEFEEMLLELDILDYKLEDNIIEINTEISTFRDVLKVLEDSGLILEFITKEITLVPNITVELDQENSEKVIRLIDILEDNDDIQDVFYNLKS